MKAATVTKKNQSNTAAYILIAIAVVVVLALIIGPHFIQVDKPRYVTTTPTGFINKVEQMQGVGSVDFRRETGFLYVTVVDDGRDKTPMAVLISRMAVESSVYQVKAIKIVDATGKGLGKAFL